MHNDEVTVRSIETADYELWLDLWKGYLSFYQTDFDANIADLTFARLCDQTHLQQQALVAVNEEVPIGFVQYIFHPHNWKVEDVCYLQDLFVAPKFRGNGVGRLLINAVYAAADLRGTPSVYWMTQAHNHAARELYDQIGELTPFVKYARG